MGSWKIRINNGGHRLSQDHHQQALDYHEYPSPGKLSITITKPTESQRDLSLAYTPGVAVPVNAIKDEPLDAYRYTAKGNLIGVITDGSAVLGLGNVGPLASKPVMEGKAVLFKRFADIDVFDIEVDAKSPADFINTVERISPTFGGINLEDIKAPECFEIENALKSRLSIPVFHDDQHGTAIIVAAGLINALEIQQKRLEDVTIVCVGAGAAGIASMKLLCALGVKKDHIFLLDSQGVIHTGRTEVNPYKFAFARDTQLRTLEETIKNADVFIGVARPDLLTPQMLASMAEKPIVFALSNPDPEIKREVALATRDDLILATGRSDYPNQVNNVLCFPYIFRGALDSRATLINQDMQIAAVKALCDLTREPVPQSICDAYGGESLAFGPDYIIPKPLDFRLRDTISKAVAQAAIDSGVAQGGENAN